jgi:hypothetical protein
VLAKVDADVVGASVSPRLEDVEAALGGGGHKAEFDPPAAPFSFGREAANPWISRRKTSGKISKASSSVESGAAPAFS